MAASGDGPLTADDWDCDLLRKKEFNIFWTYTSRYPTYLFSLWCHVSNVEGKSMTEGRVNVLQVSSPRSSAHCRANKVIRCLRKMASVDDFYQFISSKGQHKQRTYHRDTAGEVIAPPNLTLSVCPFKT